MACFLKPGSAARASEEQTGGKQPPERAGQAFIRSAQQARFQGDAADAALSGQSATRSGDI